MAPALVFWKVKKYHGRQKLVKDFSEGFNEQKAREFQKLKEIEAERAKERQVRKPESVMENFPQQKQGTSHDLAASKVGMSGKTAEKAAEVVNVIDALEQTGEADRAQK